MAAQAIFSNHLDSYVRYTIYMVSWLYRGGGTGGGGGGGATRVFTNMHGRLHWQTRTRVRTHTHTRFGPHALHSWSYVTVVCRHRIQNTNRQVITECRTILVSIRAYEARYMAVCQLTILIMRPHTQRRLAIVCDISLS